MPRPLRIDIADVVYHVINRANARVQIFNTPDDFLLFEKVFHEAKEKVDMRIYAYCVMPNHWHLILQPKNDGDLSLFVKWLTLTHTKRWHSAHDTIGSGHLYQGRYKSFPVQSDEYFLTVCRYVEQNPLRARLISKAQDWRWGSLWRREYGSQSQKALLDEWKTERSHDYLTWVNENESDDKIERLRTCVNRGQPFGNTLWTERVAKEWGLESTFRREGRPSKQMI
ncbi:transposase [Candidatus Uhrbacteria bacterium]|nr:transposase [Candidatus Uhrbacteria bacterium]